MTFVFVFLGEFGYELLNWQGVVRKFRSVRPDVDVVCCSRGDVYPLYERCRYVDIGEVDAFRGSVATMYFAVPDPDVNPASREAYAFDRKVRRVLIDHIRGVLGKPPRRGIFRKKDLRFVFSSERTVLAGCRFGLDRFTSRPEDADIYERLDVSNNRFRRIEPVRTLLRPLEARAGFSLMDPFVLIQSRQRDIRRRSVATIDERAVATDLARRRRVVWLEFRTGRTFDSYSVPELADNIISISVSTFAEQSCLIDRAALCVFFTTGDFGSHIYVPPFLGRDVIGIAPRDVFNAGTTPISFWNESVFRFGGKIEPVIAEEIADPFGREAFVDAVAQRVSG